jgi:tRNA A-37 threonylcarbamoyl transferase component Bud32
MPSMRSTASDGDTTVPGGGPPTGPTRTLDPSGDESFLRHVAGMSDEPPIVIAPGERIGETYEVQRRLGAGGMGVVYLARDKRLHRDVAIKLHAALAEDPDGARLFREATAMAQLVHANVATVYEVGTWRGHPYVVMEYVPGGTLRTWLAAAPRTPDEIVARFAAAGRGLAAAHRTGIVHRDFKPDNVLCGDDGRVRVADFGLACEANVATSRPLLISDETGLLSLTRTGAVAGTPAYMAPEQKEGAGVGPAADQYAFAVALWEALAGVRPPAGQPPRSIARVLRRGLAEAPHDRWPSMPALLDALGRKPRSRAWVIGGLVLLAAAGGAWLAFGRGHRAPARDVVGDWSGDFGRLVIRRDGDVVRGVYEHDQGTLYGHMDGDRFVGTWCEVPTRKPPADAGPFQLEVVTGDDGQPRLSGHWQYGGVEGSGDPWYSAPAEDAPPATLLARFDDPAAFCHEP